MINKELKVYKGKQLNMADFDNYTLNDYQVFINLIAKLKKTDRDGKYLSNNELTRKHTLNAKEFSKNFNTEIS